MLIGLLIILDTLVCRRLLPIEVSCHGFSEVVHGGCCATAHLVVASQARWHDNTGSFLLDLLFLTTDTMGEGRGRL